MLQSHNITSEFEVPNSPGQAYNIYNIYSICNIYIIMSQVTDPGPLNKYEYVSCSKVLKLDPVTDTWTSVFR